MARNVSTSVLTDFKYVDKCGLNGCIRQKISKKQTSRNCYNSKRTNQILTGT